jgi:tetratricopeptide (TPR) repeat protein
VTRTAAWVAGTEISSIDVGLEATDALAVARDFLVRLREGDLAPARGKLVDAALDVLHAAIEVIAAAGLEDAEGALRDVCRLRDFISAAEWPDPGFTERAELLAACSLWGWRLARRAGKPAVADGFARRIAISQGSIDEIRQGFTTDPLKVQIEEPETLLAICKRLRERAESSPSEVREDAENLCRFLLEPKRAIGVFDDREYFLGELALIAGIGCRLLARRTEAHRWFDRSEVNFRLTVAAGADRARLSYQRLALRTEERQFDEVMALLPALVETFASLEMAEDALKCRFLEAAVLKETDRLDDARRVYLDICRDAERTGHESLLAAASYNLVQIYALLGDSSGAVAESCRALPILRRQVNRIGIAKLQAGLAFLLRETGKPSEAIETFRAAQEEFLAIGMRADVAALQLVVADLLMDFGRHDEAKREILSALPVIEEYGLVSEGLAALSLLKESMRQQKIDRAALRDLHGFVEVTV